MNLLVSTVPGLPIHQMDRAGVRMVDRLRRCDPGAFPAPAPPVLLSDISVRSSPRRPQGRRR